MSRSRSRSPLRSDVSREDLWPGGCFFGNDFDRPSAATAQKEPNWASMGGGGGGHQPQTARLWCDDDWGAPESNDEDNLGGNGGSSFTKGGADFTRGGADSGKGVPAGAVGRGTKTAPTASAKVTTSPTAAPTSTPRAATWAARTSPRAARTLARSPIQASLAGAISPTADFDAKDGNTCSKGGDFSKGDAKGGNMGSKGTDFSKGAPVHGGKSGNTVGKGGIDPDLIGLPDWRDEFDS